MTASIPSSGPFSVAELGGTLLKLLRCPVCSTSMISPITLCKNGHSICSGCKSKSTSCPTCTEDFTSVRSLLAEELAKQLEYPCENAKYGCSEKCKLDGLEAHSKVCTFRLYDCFLGEQDPCPWKGLHTDLLSHSEACHSSKVTKGVEDLKSLVDKDLHIDSNLKADRLLHAHGEIFRYQYIRNAKEQKILGLVQYIGKQENADKFMYTFMIQSTNRKKKLSYMNTTHKDTEDPKMIVKSEDCFTVTFPQIDHIVQNPNLTLYVKIELAIGFEGSILNLSDHKSK